MRIVPVPELGLRIWVENQPPWQAALDPHPSQPSFVVESPDPYHPPTVMSYWSWPKERAEDRSFDAVAQAAVRRASRNFGLDAMQARGLHPTPAKHGALEGQESRFTGRADDVPMDVRVFVGAQPGRHPVALCIYTLKGKLPHLSEVVRRSWGNLAYLST